MIDIPRWFYETLLTLPFATLVFGLFVGLHDGRILGRSERQESREWE
jgi:hypothetical protein